LQHLLRLTPSSAENWLHLGDVEHKLGNRAAALQAWERVLDLPDADAQVRVFAQERVKYFGSPERRP
jgi:predicted TPR repeat methyltransferase